MALENRSHPKPTQIADALVYEFGYPPVGILRRGHWEVGERIIFYGSQIIPNEYLMLIRRKYV